MNTQAKGGRRTAVTTVQTPLTPETVRHYTPEEVVAEKLLRCSARWLKDEAHAKRIPHTKIAGRVTFRLDHIMAISMAGDVDPATYGRHLAKTA